MPSSVGHAPKRAHGVTASVGGPRHAWGKAAGTFNVDPSLLEDMGAALGGLQIDAIRVSRDGPLDGRTIGELEIRRRHRVTVAAVLRGSLADVAPGPRTSLRGGDRVVVLGRPDDVEQFQKDVGGRRGA